MHDSPDAAPLPGRPTWGETRPAVLIGGALLTLAIFVVDVLLPRGIAAGVPYIAPVFLALWLPHRRLIGLVAAACSVLTVADVFLSPDQSVGWHIVLSNRLLSIAAIWTVALLAMQRRRVEERLRSSEATHRAVLASTAEGILALDAHGRIVTANPATESLFGFSASELIGRPFSGLLARESEGLFEAESRPAPDAPQKPILRELVGLRRDGTHFPLETSCVFVPDGDASRRTVTVRDITERRVLELQLLRAADQERRALGHSLHEELGQSLTGVSLISRRLARQLATRNLAEAGDASELAAMLQEVDRQALSLYRSVVPLDATGSLADAVGALSVALSAHYDVPVTADLDAPPPHVEGFKAAQLFQLVKAVLAMVLDQPGAEAVQVSLGGARGQQWIKVRRVGPPGDVDWNERLRPLAYQSRLIETQLGVTRDGDGLVVTCRWQDAALAA